MNMSPGWDRSSSGIGYTGITKLRQTLDKICIRILVKFSSVLELISSYEHLAKTLKLRRHRKAVRILWSRFELDPSTVGRVAGSQRFSPLAVDKGRS